MKRFKKILYVHDENSDVAAATLRLAVDLAERNEGSVDLIFVVEPVPTFITSSSLVLLHGRVLKWAEKSLRELIAPLVTDCKLRTKVIEGRPHIEIIREVLRNDYDLVIKPVSPGDFIDRLLGRVDMRLLRHCPCPVWMSKGEPYGVFDSVLAAVDIGERRNPQFESPVNRQILELAFSLCELSKAELHIGHVWSPSYVQKYGDAIASNWGADLTDYVSREKSFYRNGLNKLIRKAVSWVGAQAHKSVARHIHLRQGDAGQQIAGLINDVEANVIILGTAARSGISGMVMGNRAEEILENVTCSVLAVKPPGFVSQVQLED